MGMNKCEDCSEWRYCHCEPEILGWFCECFRNGEYIINLYEAHERFVKKLNAIDRAYIMDLIKEDYEKKETSTS